MAKKSKISEASPSLQRVRLASNSNHLDYQLHTIGWKAFQDLVLTVLREVWGQTVQAFCETKDQGRDGAFFGTWARPTKGSQPQSLTGSFAVQCKFTSCISKNFSAKHLASEVEKAKLLAERGLAQHYFLFLNVSVTASRQNEIATLFSHPMIKSVTVYGKEALTQYIAENRGLRMLVPRLYGLGDLSQIIDERAYEQANQIVLSMGEDLRKFVITESYTRSAHALRDKGFVVLLGAPATGKSTIAAALAVSSVDAFFAIPVKIRTGQDFINHWNPNEKQLFWIDDAFGATQVSHHLIEDWNRSLSHLHAAIDKGSKVLMTSRDYVFNAAREALKHSEFPLFNDSQVVITVNEIRQSDRDQILYNHIKFGKHSKQTKQKLKPFLHTFSSHIHFSPEAARRLGDPFFTKELTISKEGLGLFVSNQLRILQETIQGLDVDCQSALALIFIRGGKLQSPIAFGDDEMDLIARIGGDRKGIFSALCQLRETLVLYVPESGENFWRFKHPTIQDAYASLLSKNPELLDIYLKGASLDRLYSEIACEGVKVEGIKIFLPKSRYDLLQRRLSGCSSKEAQRGLNLFLVHRCDKDFLSAFVSNNPQYVKKLEVNSYLRDSSSVALLCKLHSLGLLSRSKYNATLKKIASLVIETPDSGFLIPRIKAFLGEDNFERLSLAFRVFGPATIQMRFLLRRITFDPNRDDPYVYFHDLREMLDLIILEKSRNLEDDNIEYSLIRRIDEEMAFLRSNSYSHDNDFLCFPDETEVTSSKHVFDDVDD